MLATENAIYSWDDLYSNFDSAFKALGSKSIERWKNVLVLGMGLGSIPFLLEKKFGSKADFTLVEYDAAIIELANYYSLPRLHLNYYVYHEDAYEFTMRNDQIYDCICIDIFEDQIVPDKFHEKNFLSEISRRLSASGILIFNKLYLSEDDKLETESLFQLIKKDIFSNVYKLQTQHNMMLIASKKPIDFGQPNKN